MPGPQLLQVLESARRSSYQRDSKENVVALTRDSGLTVAKRVQRDSKFTEALFSEALNAYLAGDMRTGKAVLRELVNATVGFESLAAELKKPSGSLHHMLAPHGNPSAENSFRIVKALHKEIRVRLRVTVDLD